MKTYLAYRMIRNLKWGRSNKEELHSGSYYYRGCQSRYIKLRLKQIKNDSSR